MSVAGSDNTVDQGEITIGFLGLIGGMRLPSFKGDSTELQEWIQSIQKKEVIYGLSDQEMVLLVYEAAAGPVSKYVGGLYRESSALTQTLLSKYFRNQFPGCLSVENKTPKNY